jgi:hypothetical protein
MSRLAARVEAISDRYHLGIEAALDANDQVAFDRLTGEAEAEKAEEFRKSASFARFQSDELQRWKWCG